MLHWCYIGVTYGFHRVTLDLHWGYIGVTCELHRGYIRSDRGDMVVTWGYIVFTYIRVQRDCIGVTLGCVKVTFGLHRGYIGVTSGLHRGYIGVHWG